MTLNKELRKKIDELKEDLAELKTKDEELDYVYAWIDEFIGKVLADSARMFAEMGAGCKNDFWEMFHLVQEAQYYTRDCEECGNKVQGVLKRARNLMFPDS